MKKSIVAILLLTLVTTFTFGQVIDSAPLKGQNNSITLCDFQGDTITYRQFRICSDMLVSAGENQTVTSFTLVVLYPEVNDLGEYKVEGNILPEHIKEKIFSIMPKKIFIENVMIKDGDESKKIGSRCYIFKD
ncbi:MAG: hypothetical protein CVT94_12355 [Bacteroidetes bacterium HGW-Bacteroidetes-11]|jgi:hypothetical protein|nr:MAG: hypothetical protein CVT94_12355 [Bacteroidetes bacterium HGW-Bacteroidetes-11]